MSSNMISIFDLTSGFNTSFIKKLQVVFEDGLVKHMQPPHKKLDPINWSLWMITCSWISVDLLCPLSWTFAVATPAPQLAQLIKEMKMQFTQILHTQASCHFTFTSPIFTQRGSLGPCQTEESNIHNTSHLSSLIYQFRTNLNPVVAFVWLPDVKNKYRKV